MKKYVLLLNILLIASIGSRVSAQEDVAIAFTTCVETVYEAAEKLSYESGLTQQKAADLMNNELVKQAFKTLDQYDIQDKQIYAAVRLVAQELENEEVDEILQQVENSQAQSWFARHPVLTSILTAGGLLGGGYGLWYWWKHGSAHDIRNPNQEDDIDSHITHDTDTDDQKPISDEEENGSFSEQEKDVDSSAAHDEPSDPNSNIAERATMESPVKEDTELDLLIAELGSSKEVVAEKIVQNHNATTDVTDEAGTTETKSIRKIWVGSRPCGFADQEGIVVGESESEDDVLVGDIIEVRHIILPQINVEEALAYKQCIVGLTDDIDGDEQKLGEGSTEEDELLADDSGMPYTSPNHFTGGIGSCTGPNYLAQLGSWE